jgi:DNA-binding beta-propeller fold protein YncE
VEICAEPSNMEIYVERGPDGVPTQRYALISCFRAALVYVVDLEALRVVEAVVVGTGPHAIAIDEAREAAYVINNLESSISVIDLSRRRATRFQELARLGLQEPFSQ